MENKYLMLINPTHPLLDESIFKKVNCSSKYNDGCTAEEETMLKFRELQEFIKSKGYIIDVESGYRSKEHQQRIWNETLETKGLEHTKKYVAVPGYSEHQTGLAIDYILYEDGKWLEEFDLANHEVYKLIFENAYKFGFIIRYPKGKEELTGYNFEPWHLRYIKDVDIAKFIRDNNICFEEYLMNNDS